MKPPYDWVLSLLSYSVSFLDCSFSLVRGVAFHFTMNFFFLLLVNRPFDLDLQGTALSALATADALGDNIDLFSLPGRLIRFVFTKPLFPQHSISPLHNRIQEYDITQPIHVLDSRPQCFFLLFISSGCYQERWPIRVTTIAMAMAVLITMPAAWAARTLFPTRTDFSRLPVTQYSMP